MQSDDPGSDSGSGSTEDILARLFRNGRNNAILSWVLVAGLALVLIESLLDLDWLWILFVSATGAIVLMLPVAHRDWQMMLPWELLVLALLPIHVRALFGGELGTFGYYLSVAALALIIAVELHMFTKINMTHWFAVLFVMLTTMASAAVWSIVRWNLDQQFGTSFLMKEGMTQQEANAALMVEFFWVMGAGLAAGVLFDAYFKRRGRKLRGRVLRVIR